MKTQNAGTRPDASSQAAGTAPPAAGSSGALLEIRHVSKSFAASGGGQPLVLDDISLTVARGEFLSLVGPSGCGKTTLLRIIDGLVDQTSGEILLEGAAVTKQTRRRMGFVFQDSNLLPWMSVQGNVALGLEAAGVPKQDRRARALEALRMVGLEESADAAPYRLSGGLQQRVGVARALALRPDVLLMDEPFGHLDMLTKERLQAEMGQPYLVFLNATPLVITLPLLTVWVGTTLKARIIFISLLSIWPVLLNVAAGCRNVSGRYRELGRSLSLSRSQVIRRIVLPGVLPYFLAGARISAGLVVVGMVVAEMEVSVTGLGYLLASYGGGFQTAKLLAVFVLVSLLGLVNVGVLMVLARRFAPWTGAARRPG